MKHIRERAQSSGGLTPVERARLELFYAHQYNYQTLIRNRIGVFDSDGSLEITRQNGTKYRQDGRAWINEHIRYFEAKDYAVWYRYCARLKEVLDEYDDKFKSS